MAISTWSLFLVYLGTDRSYRVIAAGRKGPAMPLCGTSWVVKPAAKRAFQASYSLTSWVEVIVQNWWKLCHHREVTHHLHQGRTAALDFASSLYSLVQLPPLCHRSAAAPGDYSVKDGWGYKRSFGIWPSEKCFWMSVGRKTALFTGSALAEGVNIPDLLIIFISQIYLFFSERFEQK